MKKITLYTFLLSISFSSAQSFLVKEKKGKFGAADLAGKKIIPNKYDSISEVKIKNTVCIKAWTGDQFVLFNLSGKGDDKNQLTDFVPISVFPNKEFVLTQTGGTYYKTTLSSEGLAKDLSLKIPDSFPAFTTWQTGKRGIYDFKNGVWILKPEYDDIIFPIEGTIPADSLVAENSPKNKSAAYYWTMNLMGEAEIKFNKLGDLPLITIRNKKYELTNWDETKLLKGITYDSIFYSTKTNCFYGVSANGISCMDIFGNSINTIFKYAQVTSTRNFILISDSATKDVSQPIPYSVIVRIIKSNNKDTNRVYKIDYGSYDKVITLTTNKMGIYDRVKNKVVAAPKYASYCFYYPVLKGNYEYVDEVVQEENNIEYVDTSIWDPVVKRYFKNKIKRISSNKRNYEPMDGVYVKEIKELTPIKMQYSTSSLEHVNLNYPFWGLKENKEYDLLDTTGQKISEGKIIEFRYVAIKHDREFYMLKNSNGTFSLIDIYGKNVLKEKEYFLIEEKENGFNFQKEKEGKTEFAKFTE